MNIRKNNVLGMVIGCFFGVLAAGLFVNAPQAHANAIGYNPGYLISQHNFTNKSSMSAGDIQRFLESKNSGLATYRDRVNCSSNYDYMKKYYNCGQRNSAARIIKDAAQAYGISPRVILATLQKEQSLVTTPNPVSWQLDSAMGYGCPDSTGCSGFVGFFNQVDWGTWQLRANMETMGGNTYMGVSNYPCGGATRYYSTGLYPGRRVTFKDNNGVGFRTIKIVNAATASLYCYTPHTFNNPRGLYNLPRWGNKGQYFSGSYNFVTHYKRWWGSTVSRWAASIDVNIYGNAARTNELSLANTLPSGKKLYVTVSARNTGSKTWKRSFAKIATIDPRNRSSDFQNSSWVSRNRPARLEQASVAPGETGTFKFSLTTPGKDSTYNEAFQLVAEGKYHGWVAGSKFSYTIKVDSPYNGIVEQVQTYRDSGYSKPLDIGALTHNQKAYVRLKVKNTGSETWGRSFTKLASRNSDSRAFYDGSWPENNRPAYLKEVSVEPGETGTFEFALAAPGNSGVYQVKLGLVAEGKNEGWMPSATFTRDIRVVDSPLDTLYPDRTLYPGQEITSKNGKARLAFQGDGNLVVYAKGHGAVWASHTNGKNATRLIMQADGNLVLYNRGRPLWSTGTDGNSGARITMQNDGNLVMYSDGRAVWGTRTVIDFSPSEDSPQSSDGNKNNDEPSKSTSTLRRGDTLRPGDSLKGGNYRVVLQGDGNLVLYKKGDPRWASHTVGSGANRLVLQGDGNLVLYRNGKPVWASHTVGSGANRLVMQGDGNLVLYNDGRPKWATHTAR